MCEYCVIRNRQLIVLYIGMGSLTKKYERCTITSCADDLLGLWVCSRSHRLHWKETRMYETNTKSM